MAGFGLVSPDHPRLCGAPSKDVTAGTRLVLGQAFGVTRGAGHDDAAVFIVGEPQAAGIIRPGRNRVIPSALGKPGN
jgi:hypothetical protein